MRIPSGVTDQYIYFVAVDSADLKTRETGLTTFTVYRSRNGGAAVAMTTPTVNEVDSANMPGVYELLLDEDMTIDAGDDSQEIVFHITQASMAPVTRTIELYRPKITAGETLASDSSGRTDVGRFLGNAVVISNGLPDVNAEEISGTDGATQIVVQTAISMQAYHLDHLMQADAGGLSLTAGSIFADMLEENSGVWRFKEGALEETTVKTDGITAASIATDSIGSAELASDFMDAVTVETGINARQALALIGAACAGELAGAGTTTVTIEGMDVETTRVSATVDSVGNRSAVTLTPPA